MEEASSRLASARRPEWDAEVISAGSTLNRVLREDPRRAEEGMLAGITLNASRGVAMIYLVRISN
jgi:hypothetical protein